MSLVLEFSKPKVLYVCIHIYRCMAKTLMVSNSAYEELKKLKEEENKSFSEVIVELMDRKEQKTGRDLWKHFGVLKGDKEYDRLRKEIKAGWSKWQKRYA